MKQGIEPRRGRKLGIIDTARLVSNAAADKGMAARVSGLADPGIGHGGPAEIKQSTGQICVAASIASCIRRAAQVSFSQLRLVEHDRPSIDIVSSEKVVCMPIRCSWFRSSSAFVTLQGRSGPAKRQGVGFGFAFARQGDCRPVFFTEHCFSQAPEISGADLQFP